EKITPLVMVKVADASLARLLPNPGETVFKIGDKRPNNGMSQINPSRSRAWPKPSSVRQSRESARVTSIRPDSAPSSRLVGDDKSAASACRLMFVTAAVN